MMVKLLKKNKSLNCRLTPYSHVPRKHRWKLLSFSRYLRMNQINFQILKLCLVLLSLESYYWKYTIFIYCNIMKYEEMNKNKNWYFLCWLCLRNLFWITKPKLKQWDGRGNRATTSTCHVSVHRKKKQTGFHFQECERCQWQILQ